MKTMWSGGRSVTCVALLGSLALLLAACGGEQGGVSASPKAGKSPVKVGIIYSKTGLLASYGSQYLEGFKIGLDYVTRGSGVVSGHKIEANENDDAGDPTKAVSIAKDLIGQGYKILAGSTASGVALQVAPLAEQNKILFISGAAATDGVTGINKYTFRSGRQTYQDILTAKSFIGDASGKKVLVFAQDTAFGQANVAAVTAVIGAQGATVSKVLVPPTVNDFIPFAQQAKQQRPDLVFVAWAGTTAQAMWQTLDQQGVFTGTKIVTGLDQRNSYATFGPVATKIQFLSHYFYQAPKNEANTFLVDALKKQGKVPDLFHPDGFVAAQLIARAVDKADGDAKVDAMVTALEGFTFNAPKGSTTIRAKDHAVIQPMFQAKLVAAGSGFEPEIVKTLSGQEVAPPAKG